VKSRTGILVAVFFVLAPLFARRAAADVGVGAGVSPWDSTDSFKKEKKIKPVDPYVPVMARYFNQKAGELEKLSARGYGRNELVKILLVARKSGKDLREIVRLRDHNTRISAIARQFKLDYPSILAEARSIRADLDFQVPVSSATAGFDVRTTSSGVIISTRQVNVPLSSTTAQH
jgi:hypothetical protein